MITQFWYNALVWSGIQLVLASILLFAAGHRFKNTGIIRSMLLITALALPIVSSVVVLLVKPVKPR